MRSLKAHSSCPLSIRSVLFHPDDLHGRLPASREQVERLATRALLANRAAGTGFAVLAVALDGFADWDLRVDRSFADGLFRAVLEGMLGEQPAIVCGRREGGQALLFVQGLDPEEAKGLAEGMVARAPKVNLSARGGPVRSTVSVGGAHVAGFRGSADMLLTDAIRAAQRGARLATRSGGDRSAWIERFGSAPQREIARGPAPEAKSAPQAELEASAPVTSAPGEPVAPEGKDWKALPQVDLEADLEALLMERYGAAFSSYLQDREMTWERRVELLERRIEKLGSLLEGEQALRRADRQAAVRDVGVASRFRSVQGLDEDDHHFEAKQGLMAAIYEANLKLRGGDPGRTAG